MDFEQYIKEYLKDEYLGGETAVKLFELYDADASYKDKIESHMAKIRQMPRTKDGIFCSEDGSTQMCMEQLHQIYPFYMEYETRFHNKAEYASLVSQMQILKPKETHMTIDMAWYLMILIDVIDNMSQEIYEHYRSLTEIFKKTIKSILTQSYEEWETTQVLIMGYVIMKACDMRVLNCEKYAQTGLGLWQLMHDFTTER